MRRALAETALYTAALWGRPQCVEVLMKKGAHVGREDALQVAKEAHHAKVGGGSADEYAECVRLLQPEVI